MTFSIPETDPQPDPGIAIFRPTENISLDEWCVRRYRSVLVFLRAAAFRSGGRFWLIGA